MKSWIRSHLLVTAVATLLGLGGGAVALVAAQAQTAAESFDISVISQQRLVGTFPYLRNLPYDADTHWLDGDRLGYRCAWMFLSYRGELVARVTFRRTADYQDGVPVAQVTDKRMAEGALDFAGNPGDGSQTAPVAFCNETYPLTPYAPLVGDPGPRPIIAFRDATDDHVLEVRDYSGQHEPGAEFAIYETTPALTIVVFYQDGTAVAAAYYEVLRPDLIVKRTSADPPSPTGPTGPVECELYAGTIQSVFGQGTVDVTVCV